MKTGVISAWIACGLVVLATLAALDLADRHRPVSGGAVAPSVLAPHACGQADPSQSVPALACVPPLHHDLDGAPPPGRPDGAGAH